MDICHIFHLLFHFSLLISQISKGLGQNSRILLHPMDHFRFFMPGADSGVFPCFPLVFPRPICEIWPAILAGATVVISKRDGSKDKG